MNKFKRHLFLNAWILLFIFYKAEPVSASSPVPGPEDSVLVTTLPGSSTKSLIGSMSREQLSSLVDYLFEMDTIPRDLLGEINSAIAGLERCMSGSTATGAFPASDLYVSWEINNLFPEKDMLCLKGDTSVTLRLEGDKRGEYFHPFNGPVTSGFGWRDSTQHNGIDIDLKKGDKVSAAFDGMVRIAKRCGGFGNVVVIRHYNGLETVYAHLSKIKVKPGQVIVAGQVVGLGGSTGHSTGTHLHFEVRFKGVPVNPKYLISFTEQKLVCEELVLRKSKWGLAAYPKDAKSYTVEKGDTVFEIAKRFGVSTSSIRKMNGFSGRERLKAGQKVLVLQ